MLIYLRNGNLKAVQWVDRPISGFAIIRKPGIEVDDAIEIAEKTDI